MSNKQVDLADNLRLSDRNLHRLLAVVAFGLYFIYLIRATNSKNTIKLKNDNTDSEQKKSAPIHDSPKGDVLKVIDGNELFQVVTELQSTIKDSVGPPPSVNI